MSHDSTSHVRLEDSSTPTSATEVQHALEHALMNTKMRHGQPTEAVMGTQLQWLHQRGFGALRVPYETTCFDR